MFLGSVRHMAQLGPLVPGLPPLLVSMAGNKDQENTHNHLHVADGLDSTRSTLNLRKPSLTVICSRQSKHRLILLAQPGERNEGESMQE